MRGRVRFVDIEDVDMKAGFDGGDIQEAVQLTPTGKQRSKVAVLMRENALSILVRAQERGYCCAKRRLGFSKISEV